MSVLVDSNVLLDVATDDAEWFEWSNETLARVGSESLLVVDPIIYAEVSVAYDRIEDLEVALPASTYRRDPLPYDAAFLAGRAFLRYRRSGGTKATPMPDFYIGAHAAIAGYQLLTRDPKRYRTYFPTVDLIAP